MKRKMKLRVEDRQVSSLASENVGGGVHAMGNTVGYDLTCKTGCVSYAGRNCVTEQFREGDTCESGPYSQC